VPIVTATTTDTKILARALDHGVVLYPDSAKFGHPGQTIILGHSAPPDWPDIRYERAFSKINELQPGNEIVVAYAGKTYRYSVNRIQYIDKGDGLDGAIPSGNSLILVSCWPPGHNRQRIAVESLLVP
jgi:LPXTG-site transpeptidase (sortase) family protein